MGRWGINGPMGGGRKSAGEKWAGERKIDRPNLVGRGDELFRVSRAIDAQQRVFAVRQGPQVYDKALFHLYLFTPHK
jgi:hypothetical protein